MTKVHNEFISKEDRKYGFRIGKSVASSLAGFIAGFVVASIGWVAIIYMLRPFCSN
ncbi:MAG: hypothetical protein PHG66_05055 [Candidatus Colwellbacteria bacterium]|nr:hypothetical protein [Candidatus Colwellbacteria bacterium]